MTKSKALFALFIGLTFSLPAMAKLYKWVDKKGVTHYGETIPPEYADRDRAVLNKSGRTSKIIKVLSPAELKAQRLTEKKESAEKKAELEQKRHDKMLTSTYSSIKEINLARNRSLQQVKARITNHNAQLEMANKNLLELNQEVEAYTKAKKEIPAPLKDDIKRSKARISKLKHNLDKSLAEKATVEARYDADEARYRELTGK